MKKRCLVLAFTMLLMMIFQNIVFAADETIVIGGVRFSADKKTLIKYSADKKDESYIVPDSVVEIGPYAFFDENEYQGNKYLKTITIPESVTSIGDFSFYGCENIEKINIPDSIKTIGAGAFCGCTALKSIKIPDGISSLEDKTFYGCTSLEYITVPGNITKIGDDVFLNCSSLTGIVLPDTITSIGCCAFKQCEKLDSIVIPDGVTELGYHFFNGCTSLKSIVIPKSVKTIGTSAFGECEALTDIYYRGTMEEWKNLEIVDVGNSILKKTNIHYRNSADKAEIDKPSEWSRIDISRAVSSGIAGPGIPTGYTKNLTREELCYYAMNTYYQLMKEFPQSEKSPFSDTISSHVDMAYQLGVVNGVSESEFAPYAEVTKEQFATVLGRMINKIGYSEVIAQSKQYADFDRVSQWAKEHVKLLLDLGIIKGVGDGIIAPDKNVTVEEALVMLWRFFEYFGGKSALIYEDTTIEILSDLNIVKKDNLDNEDGITTLEALMTIAKAMGCNFENEHYLNKWNSEFNFEEFDYLDDETKVMLMHLPLTEDDILSLKFDDNITWYQAVNWVFRTIDDSDGSCTSDDVPYWVLGKEDIYNLAYQKGLIEETGLSNAEEKIKECDFYKMLHKAMFVVHYTGGAGLARTRMIDKFL